MSGALPPPGVLESLAVRLGAAAPVAGELQATVDGIPLLVRLALRTVGSSSTKWTEVVVRAQDVAGPPLKFFLDIRPAQPFEAAEVRAGRLRDIVVGDPAFDDAFVVEAAPEDVVRVLLDATVRAEMLALAPIRVFSAPELAFEIDREDWVEDVDVLERLVRLAARLGASLGAATHEATDARRRAPIVGGHRDGPPTHDQIEEERAADLRALDEQRERRRRRDLRNGLLLGAAIVIGVGVVIAAAIELAGD